MATIKIEKQDKRDKKTFSITLTANQYERLSMTSTLAESDADYIIGQLIEQGLEPEDKLKAQIEKGSTPTSISEGKPERKKTKKSELDESLAAAVGS